MRETHIRRASVEDADELNPLIAELGYPIPADALRERLTRVLSAPRERVIVADDGAALLGLAHVAVSDRLLSEPDAEILALVVASTSRRQGLATRLVQECVGWVREQGRAKVRVRCNTKRSDAHSFYERMSFLATKDQRVFELEIHSDGIS